MGRTKIAIAPRPRGSVAVLARCCLVAGVSLALAATSLNAQSLIGLNPGTRVRLWPSTPAERYPATVITARQDILSVRRCETCEVINFRIDRIQRLDVSSGRAPYGLRGALVGVVAGGFVGALIGDALGSEAECTSLCDLDRLERVVPGALIGVVAGGILGAVLKRETWKTYFSR